MASGGKPIVDVDESEEKTVPTEKREENRLKTRTEKGMEQVLTLM